MQRRSSCHLRGQGGMRSSSAPAPASAPASHSARATQPRTPCVPPPTSALRAANEHVVTDVRSAQRQAVAVGAGTRVRQPAAAGLRSGLPRGNLLAVIEAGALQAAKVGGESRAAVGSRRGGWGSSREGRSQSYQQPGAACECSGVGLAQHGPCRAARLTSSLLHQWWILRLRASTWCHRSRRCRGGGMRKARGGG